MSTVIQHRNVNIVTLEPGESIPDRCGPGDIAIVQDGTGWWTHFIGQDGEIESYDAPFDTYNKALWAAKAAAEYGTGEDQ